MKRFVNGKFWVGNRTFRAGWQAWAWFFVVPALAGATLLWPTGSFAANTAVEVAALQQSVPDGPSKSVLTEALAAFEKYRNRVRNRAEMTVIDYSRRSSEPRMFVIDLKSGQTKSYLVAHGRGSDPDHDGYADKFSNVPNSKASSLGAFVTGKTYYGKHGLSLRLKGLERRNSAAERRAIVMHGADYVSPDREKMGRSWGCPAIEQRYVKSLLPKLANGSFLYVAR